MFKNFTSDVLGLSDIGKIIAPNDYDKTDVDDYVFQEDNEKIYVVIKSKTDEYCFTNRAFIHLDGKSATSKKRTLHRYLYRHIIISDVHIETAGTVDLDAELKFSIDDVSFSIDIDKRDIERIRSIYKALFTISERYHDIRVAEKLLTSTHQDITNFFSQAIEIHQMPEQVILSLPDLICQTSQQVESYLKERKDTVHNYDFSNIFEKYIRW